MRAALTLVLALAASPALAATGQELFNDQCGDCHTVDAASGPTAPTLKGVVGRPVASLSDYQYGAALTALKAKGAVWTEATLNAFLADPRGYAPGTLMFGGAADPNDRKAIIDYLKSVK
jgi:cytochrome c